MKKSFPVMQWHQKLHISAIVAAPAWVYIALMSRNKYVVQVSATLSTAAEAKGCDFSSF